MGIAVFPAAGGGVYPRSQTFTSSGTFTLPAGYGVSNPLIVDIEICGGGGGGGGGAGASNSTTQGGGGGGGSGLVAVYRGVSLTSNATVTIGAGGSGGSGGSNSFGNDGTQGGTSDVNSLYYAPGGGYGTGGRKSDNLTSRWAGCITTQGYQIMGGWVNNTWQGAGGAGGSGGACNGQYTSSETATGFAGVKGMPAWNRFTTITAADNSWTMYQDILNGNGLLGSRGSVTTTAGNSNVGIIMSSFTDIAQLQRGGGGGGGYASSASAGGGAAGTINAGGQSGWRNSTSVTGSINGASATDAGCGGGGGGANAANGTGGAGGNGAAGYCIIRYMA